MKAKKQEKIRQLFNQLYCFTPEQTQKWMEQVVLMKEKGLNAMIKTLKAGLKEQMSLIESWVKKDPKFGQELMHIVDKNFKKAVQSAEKIEKKSAEEILKELN